MVPKTQRTQCTASNRIVNTYLNFAETRAEKAEAPTSPLALPPHILLHTAAPSRSVIRAAWLRLL
ncbi:MAG TPA: hypothetical protein VFV38_09985, partial [Ktedonobacteraceae bacterium]|nr:hypothetical protein [Ktedonobacteraceae bacterium]